MSYSHCNKCYKTVHTSDLHLVGTVEKDCGICGLETSAVDIGTDSVKFVPVMDIPSDEEVWAEYSTQISSEGKVTAYFHSRVLGTEKDHHSISQCLSSNTSSFHECMSQSDRKRDAMFNTQDDDI